MSLRILRSNLRNVVIDRNICKIYRMKWFTTTVIGIDCIFC